MTDTDNASTMPEFNPSGFEDVNKIKSTAEALIKFVRDLDGDPRCKNIAITKLEEASMWAVKSLFVK